MPHPENALPQEWREPHWPERGACESKDDLIRRDAMHWRNTSVVLMRHTIGVLDPQRFVLHLIRRESCS